MKTVKRVILIVLLILLVLIVAVGIWQKDNIKSFVDSLRYSEKEISQKLDDNAKKMDEIVENTEYIEVRKGGLTPEEEAAVASGEITQKEAKLILRGKTTLEKLREQKKAEALAKAQEQESKNPNEKKPEPPKEEPQEKPSQQEPQESKMTKEVSDIIAELYVIKSDFIAQLESIGASMYEEYKSIYYDRSRINEIINKNLPLVGRLERECDGKINTLLQELESALRKGGGDLSLVDEVRQYYYEEKSLKKSYYFEQIYINTND